MNSIRIHEISVVAKVLVFCSNLMLVTKVQKTCRWNISIFIWEFFLLSNIVSRISWDAIPEYCLSHVRVYLNKICVQIIDHVHAMGLVHTMGLVHYVLFKSHHSLYS